MWFRSAATKKFHQKDPGEVGPANVSDAPFFVLEQGFQHVDQGFCPSDRRYQSSIHHPRH